MRSVRWSVPIQIESTIPHGRGRQTEQSIPRLGNTLVGVSTRVLGKLPLVKNHSFEQERAPGDIDWRELPLRFWIRTTSLICLQPERSEF